MKRLYFDLGNSALKAQVWNQDGLCEVLSSIDHHHTDGWLHQLSLMLRPLREQISLIAVVSVVHEAKLQSLIDSLLLEFSCPIIPVSHPVSDVIFNSHYGLEFLGVDRWLSILGAQSQSQGVAELLVSAGTALTIDYIDDTGTHHGGVIQPGMSLSKSSLLMRSDRLNKAYLATQSASIVTSDFQPLGLNSYTAIECGVLFQAVASISYYCQLYNSGNALRVSLSGGEAQIVAEALSFPVELGRNLLFEGLHHFLKSLS